MTILYNKKHLLISKTKVTKKAISFYYVLGAGKPAPTIPSDQGFYQSLWDDQDRSNRSLKRLAPAQTTRNVTQPPTKKAKASSSMPISPEPPSNLPLSPSAPNSFEEANRMIQEAWKVAFPSLRFPVELIGFFPSRKSPLVAAQHKASDQKSPPASVHRSTNLKVAINKNLESQLLKERAFLKALKTTVAREQTESTPQTRRHSTGSIRGEPSPSLSDASRDLDCTCSIYLPVGDAGGSKL
jgi:hypothetical protein